MFMWFLGGGIGHKVTDHLQQRTPTGVHDEVPDPHDEDVIPHNTQDHIDHTQVEDDDGNGDPEEVDTDEEADYGYEDNLESEGKDNEGKDSKGKDNEGEDNEGKDNESEDSKDRDSK